MKASQLISELVRCIAEHGDREVKFLLAGPKTIEKDTLISVYTAPRLSSKYNDNWTFPHPEPPIFLL